MGESTGISWTDHTFNPWLGCQRVSPGCEKCYAETLVTGRMRLPVWGPSKTTERKRTTTPWKELPRWNRAAERDGVRRKVFCASLADIFEDHPMVVEWRAEALALLASCTSLDVQLLTKRPENIRRMVPSAWLAPGGWPAHVWIGTTVEDQRRAEERILHLLRVPAAVRFLSCEPLLEAVDLDPLTCDECWGHDVFFAEVGAQPCCADCGPGTFGNGVEMSHGWWLGPDKIEWVIVGGESGPKARPFDLAWARRIVAQCREAGVAAFVKQMGDNPVITPTVAPNQSPESIVAYGEYEPETRLDYGRHGADPSVWPEDLRVQEFPEVE